MGVPVLASSWRTWWGEAMASLASVFEYRTLTLPRQATRSAAKSALTEVAEYGRWELDRHRIYPDGRRKVRLRRRILRPDLTMWTSQSSTLG